MIVGLCQFQISLQGNRSLKGKRHIVRRLTDRIRHKFHISIAEVGHLDRHQSSLIAFAVIGNETPFVQSLIDQILNAIEQMQLAPLVDVRQEILHYNDHFDPSTPHSHHPHPNEDLHDAWDFMDEWRNLK